MNEPVRSKIPGGTTYPPVPARALPDHDGFPTTSRSVELAAELLDVVNESELERFVRKLVSETTQAAGVSLSTDTRQALSDVLARTARHTVPTLSAGAGSPSRSGTGRELSAAETAARVFGLELEGMSAEDRDFEIARRLVRFAQTAVLGTAAAHDSRSPAATVAEGVARAGQKLAPGLVPLGRAASSEPSTGPWMSRGNDVELIGVEPPRR